MGTILESTNELAKRFGVEGEMTIKDTLDAIVKKLDDTYTDSKDIAEAVSEFSKNDGPDARLGTKTITVNDTYAALDDDLDGYSSVTVDVSGEAGFTKMGINAIFSGNNGSPANANMVFINNTETSVDVSEMGSVSIIILNPVNELKVRPLATVGVSYNVAFIPTATCKVYEDETELDLAEIFQPQQTPAGPTYYDPDGSKAHFISGSYSPYDGQVRKLYDSQRGFNFTIE